MGLNIPAYTEGDFSFGPGRIFLGAAGTTPSIDVGGITEDGITIDLESEKKDIMQGNPKLIAYTFSQAQGCMVKATGIEWNFDNFTRALGAGNTTSTGTEKTYAFGGNPIVERIALKVQHQMAVLGHTMNAYIWQAVADGNLSLPMGHDEHQFEYSWKGQRVTTNWAGGTLAFDEELIRLERLIA